MSVVGSLFLLQGCVSSPTDLLKGKVVGVSDGDTFTLLINGNQQVKVRLYGIDCPEKNQAFGQKAKEFASDLIFGKYITVEVKDKDRYGRTVGIAINGEGLNLNEELLKAGFAWHYKQYSKSVTYALLEEKAKESKVGIWADKNPIPP